MSNEEKTVQTDEELIYNYAWQKFYHYFQQTANSKNKSEIIDLNQQFDSINISQAVNKEIPLITEGKNGIYFDYQSGLYYDSEKTLYFDDENKVYYEYKLSKKTGTYHLRFHSQIPRNDWRILSRKLGVPEERTESENNDDFEDLTTKYPPCIRAILIKSRDEGSSHTLGSLFLIPYTGGVIGRNKNCNLIDFTNEIEVDKCHAFIEYDLVNKEYLIKDKKSKTGTFLNDELIETNHSVSIGHGDRLRIGYNELILHIHSGSTTCINCEPGEVIARLNKIESENLKEINNKVNTENLRRHTNREMKKKYGLKFNNFDKNEVKLNDKAKLRRETVGIDTSHIEKKDSERASVESFIPENNIGYKLLKNMGWQQGQGLGKLEDGICEPINQKIRVVKRGLGHEESEKKKNKIRFNNLVNTEDKH